MDSTTTANSGGSATGGLLSKADWKPDQSSLECNGCQLPFTIIRRRHHCRMCGSIFCDACSSFYSILPQEYGYSGQQRLCKSCNNSFEQKRQYYETDSLVARFQLRSTAEFEYIKPLQDIGNTKNGLRKSYGMAKNSGSGDECIVSIITPNASTCPWSMTNEKKKRKFEKTLLSLKHPYIMTPLKVEVSGANDKILIIRSFNKSGSLRDLIYKSKPLSPFDTKYNNSKNSKAATSITSTCLPVKSIQKYSKQILESLLYLKSKGIQFIHIHCSNVLIVNDNCQLIDIENNLLGMKSYYNEYLSNSTNSNQEVVCFGHLLFEMIVGIPLGDHSNINSFIPLFPDKVFLILQQIFNVDKPTPSLEELVKHSWFEVTTTIEQQSSLSTNGKLKKSQLAFIKDTSGKFEQPKANLSNSFSSGNISKLSTTSTTTTTGSINNNGTGTKNNNNNNNKLNNSLGSSGGSNSSFSPSSPTSNTVSPNSSFISSPPKNPIFQSFTPPAQTTTTKSSAPPPPPPPPTSTLRTSNSSNPAPPTSTNRNSLLDSIRNPENMKKLKKQTPNANKSKSTIGPGSLKPSALKKK